MRLIYSSKKSVYFNITNSKSSRYLHFRSSFSLSVWEWSTVCSFFQSFSPLCHSTSPRCLLWKSRDRFLWLRNRLGQASLPLTLLVGNFWDVFFVGFLEFSRTFYPLWRNICKIWSSFRTICVRTSHIYIFFSKNQHFLMVFRKYSHILSFIKNTP